MTVARKFYLPALVAMTCAMLVAEVVAQPLVTGDLSIYYNFDSFTNTVMDGSGNGFNAKVQDGTRNVLDGATGRPNLNTTGVISNDTSTPRRGAGAVRFTQTDQTWMDPNAPDPSAVVIQDPVFLDLDGSVIVANAPTKVPTGAATYAAWVNLAPVNNTNQWNTDASIVQGSTSDQGHATPHFQAQANGTIRLSIRDQASGNIANTQGAGQDPAWTAHPYVNQPAIDAVPSTPPELWPTDTWFHLAATYDRAANGGAGLFAVYYNGVVIRSGPPLGPAVGSDIGQWGPRLFDARESFYDGLGIGAVYDSGGRRLHGLMDEFYLFTRALSAAEIGTLYNIAAAGTDGDYNNDGKVDAADWALWRNGGPLQNDPTPGVQPGDEGVWRAQFGKPPGAGSGSDLGAVPEPASIGLLLICLGILAAKRHR